ncbi:MAG: restriction endonuclease subunit S [Cyclobacteriaceae bacterium]|nr:restriction endonuclease subunit S [Cyclobacteriaceae bacterium]
MGNLMNIPKLRFPEFRVEKENLYKKHFFKEIFLFSTGKNIKQNEASPEFEIPCVRYGELYHMYNEVISEVINKTNLDKSELLFSNGDEILLPSAGEDPLDIGSASALTIRNVAIGRTINILKPAKENIYSQIYVSYYINEKLRKTISTLAKGVSISNVYNSDLKTLEIMLPKLPEQIKVASFLTSIEKKLQALKNKKAHLEQYKKGVMQKLFSQELRFKDENGNDFPDWEIRNLGKVLIKNSVKNKGQKYSLVQSVSNKHGFINQDEMFEDRRVASKDTSNYYVIEKGHFAYNPSRINVGSLAYKFDDEISVISPLYISFKSNKDYLKDSFLLNWFSSQEFIRQMNSSFEGSVRNTLSYESLVKMEISIPNNNEQIKISNFLSEIDVKIGISENQISKVETWKKGLLQKMFC